MRTKKWTIVCVAVALSASLLGSPAWAADGQANQRVEIKVKLNTANATVNGQEVAIEKPYQSQGTTMIPLSLLTSSFGVTLQYDSESQMIELGYNGRTVKLKAGSKEVWINGKAVTLPAAPELKNGKTMVPLSLLTQGLGLQIVIDAKTKDVIIAGTKQASDIPKTGGSLDSDLGKTAIGDSYYGWKINYPTGLIKNYQSFQGDYVRFSDAKDAYFLEVYVEKDQPENLSGNGLLSRLTDMTENSILSKGYVSDPKLPYARLITKDEDGFMNEERAYQSGTSIFYVTLTVKNAAEFNNPIKYSGYKQLLDSFSPSFPQGDRTVKDLSTVEGNYRWFTQDDFGLKIKVPADWSRNYSQQDTVFGSDAEDQWLMIKVTSKEDDLTLDSWVSRHEQMYRDETNDSYLKIDPEVSSSMIAGVPAKERKISVSEGSEWYTVHHLFFFKGNYKFYVEIGYDRDQAPEKAAEMIRTIKQSISIDTNKMNPSLGVIADDDLIDKNKTATVKNKEFKYSINIPEYWRETGAKGGNRSYEFPGGSFTIVAGPGQLSDVKKMTERMIEEGKKTYEFTFKENKEVTIAQSSGHKYVFQGKDGDIRFERTLYLVQNGKNTFMIFWTIHDSAKTKVVEQRLQNVIDSLQFS